MSTNHPAHHDASVGIAKISIADSQHRQDHTPSKYMTTLSQSSRAIHADDFLNVETDVAPPIHVSTTFRYNENPDLLIPISEREGPFDGHIYSRETGPNTTRFEAVLGSLLDGPVLTYGSGLAAFHAMLVFLNPKRIAIGDGYHGCHAVVDLMHKLTGLQKLPLDCAAEELQEGDIIHVETPWNPTGEARNLVAYAQKAHSRGAFLTVDATFAPPPLQEPFKCGADIIFHSGTKYVGGHSDMLCGILAVKPERANEGWWDKMKVERTTLGGTMGSLEGWLGIRSVRTMEIRVQRQSENAEKLVKWLHCSLTGRETELTREGDFEIVQNVVAVVKHASLQEEDLEDGWLKKQMPNGFGAVFSITMKSRELAMKLPSQLKLFHHATSLGGVESLIEWRAMTDSTVDKALLRVSIGIEGWEDLREDFLDGFRKLGRI